MLDNVSLIIDNKTYSRISRLSCDSNIYTAAGEFEFEINSAGARSISTGMPIKIMVNDTLQFTGTVERDSRNGSKTAQTVVFSGRDLMGHVVSTYLTSFKSLAGKKLSTVAQVLLSSVAAVKQSPIVFEDGADKLDVAQAFVQPAPGQTVFQLLSGMAAARGIHFYMRADGTIVFGKPKGFGGSGLALWCIEGGGTNVDRYDFVNDISQRYSDITVYGQKQSGIDVDSSALPVSATVHDELFPESIYKPFVVESQMSGVSPKEQARMILEQQRFDGWQLKYTVRGLSQHGTVWQPEQLCAVDDWRLPYHGMCLVYGRSFTTEKNVLRTSLTLGQIGVR